MRINRIQRLSGLVVMFLAMTAAAFAGVSISAPSPGATTGSPVHFVASASASAPISAMRIYVDNNSMYTVNASSLDTYVSLGNGGHDVVIVAWDTNGNPYRQEETITVSGSSGGGGGGGGSGVSISSPASGATVGSPVHVVASATFGGSVAAMRIYIDGNNMYTVNAGSIDTYVNAGTGSHDLAVVAWDNNGTAYKQEYNFTVGSSSGGGGGGGGSGSGVSISAPSSGATVSSPFTVTASASASTSISAMRIYLDGNDMYTVSSNQLNTSVSASSGTHDLAVVAWDSNGTAYKQEYNITVSGSGGGGGGGGGTPSGATTFWEIQQMSGWGSCTVCAGAGGSGPAASYWTSQGVGSPSLSGSSMQFHISGSTPYSDVLWWKDLTPNDNATNYKYDVDFYIANPQYSQALEFDVNVNVGNAGTYFIFGTQCDIDGGGQFDVWDTAGNRWVPTGAWCGRPSAYTWHHLTWEFTRTNSQATFIAVTLDGNKQYINYTFWGKGGSWPAINVAFQMDGDSNMDAYSVWLDNVTLSYW
ncbi:MAG TPA: Ig-like domain-containing protein [Candidatus Angelobacter sp.]